MIFISWLYFEVLQNDLVLFYLKGEFKCVFRCILVCLKRDYKREFIQIDYDDYI